MASIKHLAKPKNPSEKPQKNNPLIWIIILIALSVRLYKINTPLADWHSWRQTDTASVANEFVKNGIRLLKPTYQDLSDIPSGMDNPEGFRMVEFPFISADVAFIYKLFSFESLPLHVFYRIDSIIFSLGSVFLLYKLVQLFEDEKTSLLAAFIFSILPYNIFYSRTVLPEVGLVFFILLELFAVSKYFLSNNYSLKNPYFWIGAISGSLAVLLKPYALVFALPMLYLALKKQGIKIVGDWKLYLYIFIIILPYVLWRSWIGQFPEGIPAYEWLLNGNNIRFKGAFFRWIFADRIGRLILGYWGLILLGLGLINPGFKFKESSGHKGFFSWWLFAILIYLTVLATGNVQHDYYQIITIPIICIYVAKGATFLLNAPKKIGLSHTTSYLLLTTVSMFMLAFGWYEVRGYYNINNPAIVSAGEFVDKNTPPDSLIIAPYGGDTAFLYQTNRQGWPIGGSIEKRIKQGADYYVTTSLDEEAKQLISDYQVLETNDQFTLIKLVENNNQEAGELESTIDQSLVPSPVPNSPSQTPSPSPSPAFKLPPGLQKKIK